jgi:ABC-type cobalamin/Fe3+-siderophores transport system ATPase subunit
LAEKVPVHLIQEHGGMDTVDLVLFLMVLNQNNKYIVVEALAGCGKTAMLSGLIKRLPEKKGNLILSFTRQAITVARVRARKEINVQTFDSLFYQTVKHGFVKEMGKEMGNALRPQESN